MARPVPRALVLLLAVVGLAFIVPAGAGAAASPAAKRLARRYAVATVEAQRELRPVARGVRREFTHRLVGVIRCALTLGPAYRKHILLITEATTVYAFGALNPALPVLQRYADRLYFAGRSDRVLARGARAWVALYRALARRPWVSPHVCARVHRWRRHHFARAYAPITPAAGRRFLVSLFRADGNAVDRATRRLAALGVRRRIRRLFAGGLIQPLFPKLFSGGSSNTSTGSSGPKPVIVHSARAARALLPALP